MSRVPPSRPRCPLGRPRPRRGRRRAIVRGSRRASLHRPGHHRARARSVGRGRACGGPSARPRGRRRRAGRAGRRDDHDHVHGRLGRRGPPRRPRRRRHLRSAPRARSGARGTSDATGWSGSATVSPDGTTVVGHPASAAASTPARSPLRHRHRRGAAGRPGRADPARRRLARRVRPRRAAARRRLDGRARRPLAPAADLVAAGGGAVVALPGPGDDPPPGTVGYWTDGAPAGDARRHDRRGPPPGRRAAGCRRHAHQPRRRPGGRLRPPDARHVDRRDAHRRRSDPAPGHVAAPDPVGRADGVRVAQAGTRIALGFDRSCGARRPWDRRAPRHRDLPVAHQRRSAAAAAAPDPTSSSRSSARRDTAARCASGCIGATTCARSPTTAARSRRSR